MRPRSGLVHSFSQGPRVDQLAFPLQALPLLVDLVRLATPAAPGAASALPSPVLSAQLVEVIANRGSRRRW